jgi:hypothetical protein
MDHTRGACSRLAAFGSGILLRSAAPVPGCVASHEKSLAGMFRFFTTRYTRKHATRIDFTI